jgi:hypothetical protein
VDEVASWRALAAGEVIAARLCTRHGVVAGRETIHRRRAQKWPLTKKAQ